MNQPTAKPTRKVTAAFIGALLVAVATAIVQGGTGVNLPPYVVALAGLVLTVVPAYLTAEKQA